jgi:hypothetical protein
MCWIAAVDGSASGKAELNRGNSVINETSTKVKKQLGDTQPLQTLAKADKLTITVERIDMASSDARGATWSDAVVIYPGGPVRMISGPFPTGGSAPADLGEVISGPLPTRGGARQAPRGVSGVA